mmetsp:Transcript_6111/g.15767  ORF Transcript_6111/g.15767 Transcript_6111/m.15767 type:complete len:243 (-) Transcript_6111:510-1238(-)
MQREDAQLAAGGLASGGQLRGGLQRALAARDLRCAGQEDEDGAAAAAAVGRGGRARASASIPPLQQGVAAMTRLLRHHVGHRRRQQVVVDAGLLHVAQRPERQLTQRNVAGSIRRRCCRAAAPAIALLLLLLRVVQRILPVVRHLLLASTGRPVPRNWGHGRGLLTPRPASWTAARAPALLLGPLGGLSDNKAGALQHILKVQLAHGVGEAGDVDQRHAGAVLPEVVGKEGCIGGGGHEDDP